MSDHRLGDVEIVPTSVEDVYSVGWRCSDPYGMRPEAYPPVRCRVSRPHFPGVYCSCYPGRSAPQASDAAAAELTAYLAVPAIIEPDFGRDKLYWIGRGGIRERALMVALRRQLPAVPEVVLRDVCRRWERSWAARHRYVT